MRVDVGRLKAFYASPLGGAAHAMIQRRVEALWPNANGQDVLGLGFSEQLLEQYCPDARRVVSAAPAEQGASRWPVTGRCQTSLVEEERLPFPDAMFDRILVQHALEEADSPARLLRELWRIAAPEARILLIVSHRSGLWSRAESTPFGHGRPYSKGQLLTLMQSAMFQPTAWTKALYAPPASWPFITSAAETWEKTGEIGWRGFGGVIMVEAVKRLYIDPQNKAPADARRVKTTAPVARPSPFTPNDRNHHDDAATCLVDD